MFTINGTNISLSRGDTGAILLRANAKRKDTGATYIFSPRDRALFSLRAGNGTIVKQKQCELINTIMTVMAERTGSQTPISARIDKSEFNAAMEQTEGTFTANYTSSWDNNPALYGITVSGTPQSGDKIEVKYRKNDFTVTFLNADTDTLSPGGYTWDVRYVINPYYDEEGKIVDGDQVITPNSPMSMNLLTVVGDI